MCAFPLIVDNILSINDPVATVTEKCSIDNRIEIGNRNSGPNYLLHPQDV
jgi:hypothetical protein